MQRVFLLASALGVGLMALPLAAQTVSRTPTEKTFITDIVGIDGYFDDLLNPPGIPEFEGDLLEFEDPTRAGSGNGTRELEDETEILDSEYVPRGPSSHRANSRRVVSVGEMNKTHRRVNALAQRLEDLHDQMEKDGRERERQAIWEDLGRMAKRLDLLNENVRVINENIDVFGPPNQENMRNQVWALEELGNEIAGVLANPLHADLREMNSDEEDAFQRWEDRLALEYDQNQAEQRRIQQWNDPDYDPGEERAAAESAESYYDRYWDDDTTDGSQDSAEDGSGIQVSQKNFASQHAPLGPRIWANLSYSGTKNTSTAAREGHSIGITSGVVFQPRPDLSWGIGVSVSDGENSSAPPLNTILDSTTLGLSAFVTHTTPQDVNLTFIGSYQRGNHDISINGFTGSYGTGAFSGTARVSKAFQAQDGWIITPSFGVTFASVNRETYVNSAARTITGGTQSFGILQPAMRFEKVFFSDRSIYAPWFEINGDWLFEKPASATLSDGLVLGQSDTGLGLSAGVEIFTGNSTHFNLSAGYRKRGDDQIWNVSAGFKKTF